MKLVGLTGGIGSGKSTVAALLRDRGATTVDVDQLSRRLQTPGQPLFEAMVSRWGQGIVAADGSLDREALGRIVFSDAAQLQEITNMAAPFTEQALYDEAMAHQGTDDVVLYESAMYGARQYGMEGLIVVDTSPEVALDRLVRLRGMPEADARARIARQLTRDQRLARADFVLRNDGDPHDLTAQLDACWAWIRSTADATPSLDRSTSR